MRRSLPSSTSVPGLPGMDSTSVSPDEAAVLSSPSPDALGGPDVGGYPAPVLPMPRWRAMTWNINSIRMRVGLLAEVVQDLEPDLICLQETKCPDPDFPRAEVEAMGYPYIAHVGMKGYNGMAMLSRTPMRVRDDAPQWCGKDDCRHLAVDVDVGLALPLEVHGFYVPAGGDTPDRSLNSKFAHKLDFLDEVRSWMQMRAPMQRALVLGDLNVAPQPWDVWNHRIMSKNVSHTPVEVAALEAWKATGPWIDAVRVQIPDPTPVFSWWSYRAKDWVASNRGLRLDHIWTTQDLLPCVRHVGIEGRMRGWAQPSDHVPLIIDLDMQAWSDVGQLGQLAPGS